MRRLDQQGLKVVTIVDPGVGFSKAAEHSFETLRRGLPQAHCYDLVYRHGLVYNNGLLAFGTTTGNLFISRDRGDSWKQIAGFLPPIYSVQII